MRVRELLVDSLKESLVFGAISLPVAYVVLLEFRLTFADSVGFVLLLESCGLMLIGGAMDLVTAPGVKKVVSLLGAKRTGGNADMQARMEAGAATSYGHGAAVYTLTGVILFVASLALAAILLAY